MPPATGARAHDGSMQIGNVDVDAEPRDTGGLGNTVEACEGPADVLPPFARLEWRLRWQLKRCRRCDEAAVRQAFSVPGDDMAVVGTKIRRGDAEIVRGRVQQQLPHVGGGLSQRQEVRAHRGAGAGRLHAEDRVAVGRVDGGELDPQRGRRDVQLFADQRRQPGGDALSHLVARAVEANDVVRRQLQKRIRHEAVGGARRERRVVAEHGPADHQARAADSGHPQKPASRELHDRRSAIGATSAIRRWRRRPRGSRP